MACLLILLNKDLNFDDKKWFNIDYIKVSNGFLSGKFTYSKFIYA